MCEDQPARVCQQPGHESPEHTHKSVFVLLKELVSGVVYQHTW